MGGKNFIPQSNPGMSWLKQGSGPAMIVGKISSVEKGSVLFVQHALSEFKERTYLTLVMVYLDHHSLG